MKLIILVKNKHRYYENKWDKEGRKLKSITTEPNLGERLLKAMTSKETILVLNPDTRYCIETQVADAKSYEVIWAVNFVPSSQKPVDPPIINFEEGTIGADFEGKKIFNLYLASGKGIV